MSGVWSATRRAALARIVASARRTARFAAPAAMLALIALASISTRGAFAQPAGPAPAGPAPVDTTLRTYLDSLSVETEAYFGVSAAKPDTAGLDSALAYFLDHPTQFPGRRRLDLAIYPDFSFNRVDGPVWMGVAAIGNERRWGRIAARPGYASGPNLWLGTGEYRKEWGGIERWWSFEASGGRETASLDRTREQRRFRALRVFLTGKDRGNYYRRDGWEAHLSRETPTTRFGVGFRDQLESPRTTTAAWSLFHGKPSVYENLAAAFGRVREAEYEVAWRLPRVPVTAEIVYLTSGQPLGSDFDYRRTQVSISGNFGVGRTAALVPQFTYGTLSGIALPQTAFYLGGRNNLRSVPGSTVIGSRMTAARLEIYRTGDIFEWAHLPRLSTFPIQGALFVATGAVWGPDPFGGPSLPGTDWPKPEGWISEAGFSLLYQPGLPDPTGFIRVNFAWGLGPGAGDENLVTIAYSRALDFVRPFRQR